MNFIELNFKFDRKNNFKTEKVENCDEKKY